MKKLAGIRLLLILGTFGLMGACNEDGLNGTLKISITDAPVDAQNIEAVNLIILEVEGLQGGQWKAFRNFEQPVGINLLAYSGGKSAPLVDQFNSPGEFDGIKLSLNIANRDASLIVNPQSAIVLKDGSSKPIYMPEGVASEIIVEKNFGVSSRGLTDLTIDIDARKSIRINDAGEYILMPAIRVVNTNETGQIEMSLLNKTFSSSMVVYVYRIGQFSLSETNVTQEGVSFSLAITSAAVRTQKVNFGFLEEGAYELIFVKHRADGTVDEVLGKSADLKITPREVTSMEIDLTKLKTF